MRRTLLQVSVPRALLCAVASVGQNLSLELVDYVRER
jgi:hypothetical protein